MAEPTPTTVKVLTVGPAIGAIKELFAKIKSIDAKHGKFEFAICVGDFFGPLKDDNVNDTDDEVSLLLDGKIEVPIPCYIMQGDQPLPDKVIEKFANSGMTLCPNLYLLSKSGIQTTAHGIRIACLGGIYDQDVYSTTLTPLGFSDPYFSSQTMDKLTANIFTNSSNAPKANTLAAIKQAATSLSASPLIDIFISNVWPSAITNFSAIPHNSAPRIHPVDDVIRSAKPRYHFAVGAGSPPQFWEREPFVWDEEEGRVSRFVSLGAFGGNHGTDKKPRWFYAFSISPNSSTTSAPPRPANATKNPFTSSLNLSKRSLETSENENYIFGNVKHPSKRVRTEHSEREPGGKPPSGYSCRRCGSAEHFINDCPERNKPPEGYVCKICNVPGHLVRDCPTRDETGDTGGRKPPQGYVCRACGSELHLIKDCPVAAQSQNDSRNRTRGPPKEIAPDECWFCLSNPRLAKHLIVSIGSECYLTLPKGQIIPTGEDALEDISSTPGGGHVLIVPITHYPTLNTIPPDLSSPILEEVETYKTAVRAMYAKHGASSVMFEVAIAGAKGGHAHVQVVPIPSRLKDQVEGTFLKEAQFAGISFESDAEDALESCAGGQGNYFRVDLPDGRKMVHIIKQNTPFSIQFGRHVLCGLLGIPDRKDWKLCAQSDDRERIDALTFKTAFTPFDNTQ